MDSSSTACIVYSMCVQICQAVKEGSKSRIHTHTHNQLIESLSFKHVSHCSQILRCWRMCSGWSAIHPTGLRTHVSCVDASLPHATWLVKTPLRTPATEPKTSLLRSAGQWMTWHLVHFLMFLLKRSLWCSPRLHLFD